MPPDCLVNEFVRANTRKFEKKPSQTPRCSVPPVKGTRMGLFRWVCLGAFAVGFSLSGGACDLGTYVCTAHAECEGAGPIGRCEAVGYCSFVAGDCESGRRFGGAAPEGIRGRCVPPDEPDAPPPHGQSSVAVACPCPAADGSCPTECDDEPHDGPDEEPESPCTDDGEGTKRNVDVLLVLDDTESFAEARAELTLQLGELTEVLTGTDDLDVHLGVIGPDLGDASAGSALDDCTDFGFEGMLESTQACGGDGLYLAAPLTTDDATLESALTCVIERAPTGGCTLEQPLEAALRAVSTSGAGLSFPEVAPHGDRANAGFSREDSLLVVVVATDEEDCSIEDPEAFAHGSPVELACLSGATWPTSRYVEGLIALRDPKDLVFVVIGGMPGDAINGTQTDYDALLDDPRMRYVSVEGMSNPLPTCRSELVFAEPARRLATVAGHLSDAGATTSALSVCSMDAATWTRGIADAIQAALPPAPDGC